MHSFCEASPFIDGKSCGLVKNMHDLWESSCLHTLPFLKGKFNLFLKNVVGGFPCTLHFRVRFFIPDPNTLQQEQTR